MTEAILVNIVSTKSKARSFVNVFQRGAFACFVIFDIFKITSKTKRCSFL